jgi:Lhr-like helicase
VQIPSKSSDPFIKSMTEKSEKARSIFQEKIASITKSIPVKLMLGDSTVVEQNTFDPKNVETFYQNVLKKIPDWKTQGISVSNDKDLRRIFIKFEISEGNYLLSCHMSLQYHASLYYKVDHRVVEIQKELADILEKTNTLQSEIAPKVDLVIQEKLKEIGYENVDNQKLFEIFFQNESFTKEIIEKVHSSSDKNFEQYTKKQSELFKELDNMLFVVYHTTSVMIDEMRLIAAEEGCLCNFDLEHMKNQTKEGNFDPIRIPAKVKDGLLNRMDQTINALQN